MQCARDIELNFPIKDAPSASLMVIKADCLHKAGIINEAEKRHVHSRARNFLSHLTDASAATSRRHLGDHQPVKSHTALLGIRQPLAEEHRRRG
jgi:hypothetical protein